MSKKGFTDILATAFVTNKSDETAWTTVGRPRETTLSYRRVNIGDLQFGRNHIFIFFTSLHSQMVAIFVTVGKILPVLLKSNQMIGVAHNYGLY